MATVFKGQTFPGYISPTSTPGITEPIRWTYRGMFPAMRQQFLTDIENCPTPEAKEALMLEYMEQLIVKWDVRYSTEDPDKTKAGKIVPIKADVIREDLMLHVRNRIFAVSTWQAFGDIDPQLPNKEKAAQAQQMAGAKSPASWFEKKDDELVKN